MAKIDTRLWQSRGDDDAGWTIETGGRGRVIGMGETESEAWECAARKLGDMLAEVYQQIDEVEA